MLATTSATEQPRAQEIETVNSVSSVDMLAIKISTGSMSPVKEAHKYNQT